MNLNLPKYIQTVDENGNLITLELNYDHMGEAQNEWEEDPKVYD